MEKVKSFLNVLKKVILLLLALFSIPFGTVESMMSQDAKSTDKDNEQFKPKHIQNTSSIGKIEGFQTEDYQDIIERMRLKGKREGISEGQKLAALKIARKMLGKNSTVEEIMEITELSREEIEALRSTANK